MSPQGYDVRSRSVRSENTLDLNRDERASRDANERKVGVAAGQDPQVARIAHVKHAAGVGRANVNLVRKDGAPSVSDGSVENQSCGARDTRHPSNTAVGDYRRANQPHDRREVLSGVHKYSAQRGNGSLRAVDSRAADSRDVDGIGRDDGDARADLKLLICHYLKGNVRFKLSLRRPHPQSLPVALDTVSTTFLMPVALVTFSTASPKPFMPPS